MAVVAAIPWKVILQALPTVVVTAKDLWQHWSSRKSAPVDPHADVRTQMASVAEKLAALESAETEQAKIVSQIAEQLQGIARRVSITYWLAISGLALSCAALLLAALR
jgi:hypothetical protein